MLIHHPILIQDKLCGKLRQEKQSMRRWCPASNLDHPTAFYLVLFIENILDRTIVCQDKTHHIGVSEKVMACDISSRPFMGTYVS